MEETLEFNRHTKILFIGELINFILSLGLNLFLIRFLTIDEFSYFNRILVIPTILVYVADFGLFHGCLYYVARFSRSHENQESRNVIMITLIVKSLIGLGLSLLLMIFSQGFISTIIGIQEQSFIPILQIASFLLLGKSMLEGVLAVLQGLMKMLTLSILKIIQIGSQLILTVFLVILGFRLNGSVIGFVISMAIAGVIGVLYLYKKYLKNKEEGDFNWNYLPKIVRQGFFYSFNSILTNNRNDFFTIFLTLLSFFSEVSYLKVGISITTVFYLILRPIKLTITPIFSKHSWNNEEDRKVLTQVFHYSIRFSTILITPVIFFTIIFASELIPVIFGSNYAISVPFNSLFLSSFIPLTIGMMVVPPFLFGQRLTRLAFLVDFISVAASVSLAVILSISFGGLGYALGISLGAVIGLLFAMFITHKIYGKLFPRIREILFIVIIAGILCLCLYISYSFFINMFLLRDQILRLIISGFIFLLYSFLYLVILIRLKLIKYTEITYFLKEFQKIPIFNKIFLIIVKLVKKMSKSKS